MVSSMTGIQAIGPQALEPLTQVSCCCSSKQQAKKITLVALFSLGALSNLVSVTVDLSNQYNVSLAPDIFSLLVCIFGAVIIGTIIADRSIEDDANRLAHGDLELGRVNQGVEHATSTLQTQVLVLQRLLQLEEASNKQLNEKLSQLEHTIAADAAELQSFKTSLEKTISVKNKLGEMTQQLMSLLKQETQANPILQQSITSFTTLLENLLQSQSLLQTTVNKVKDEDTALTQTDKLVDELVQQLGSITLETENVMEEREKQIQLFTQQVNTLVDLQKRLQELSEQEGQLEAKIKSETATLQELLKQEKLADAALATKIEVLKQAQESMRL